MIDIFLLGVPFLVWLAVFVGIHIVWFACQSYVDRKSARRSREYHRRMKGSFGDDDDDKYGGRP
jgi:hypothetical protein